MTEEELIEQLAAQEHASWAQWMRYLLGKCERTVDGSLRIPVEYERALRTQMATDYADLSAQEQEYDRKEVRYSLPIIRRYAAGRVEAKVSEFNEWRGGR